MMKFNGFLCGLLMAASSLAQAQVTTTETTTTARTSTEVRRVSQILGSTVQLQGVNNFGKVEDIILSDSGGIGYLVVSANGKSVLLPWDAGTVNYAQRVVTYDVTPQAVQPFYFERNAYPNFSDQQYTTRMQQVFPTAGAVRSVQPDASIVPNAGRVRPVQPDSRNVPNSGRVRPVQPDSPIVPNAGQVRPDQPGGPAVESTEKVRVRPNGKVIIKEELKSRDR